MGRSSRAAFEGWEEDDDVSSGAAAISRQPGLARIPQLEFEFCEQAQLAYWHWCGRLKASGLLTDETLGWVNSLTQWTNDLHKAMSKGRSIRYAQGGVDSALKKLNRLYDDSSLSAAGPAQNPYAAFGFAKRARSRRHGQN